MVMSADEVIEENRSWRTLSGTGKLAICLERQFLCFGDSVLLLSSERTDLDLIQQKWHHFMMLLKKKVKSTSVHDLEKKRTEN